MAQPQNLVSRREQNALILTITQPHLRGYNVANALRKELLTAISNAPPTVILDMQAVVSFSSEAFRPLLSLRHHLESQGARLILCNLSPMVAQALSATRMVTSQRSAVQSLEMQPTLESALASLQESDTEA